ncbi:hypothetical protein JI721_14680 [Alicyclobacillus cycloheptanicus]|uniref:Uncharacterized protein n=1 Tax=Alicyclobacillus cycloheptanicus TaxID=1457 RepID=A0ABT9XL37_9BACL|nr:hypothetical protein [Alicyclobacillus cycloheptanicus]MDQ0191021.1 hypothetical protein [Alicyclobacillus cycloheptanicus]WDM00913.1 hypothetical protein JI721_14680 [Alicyclobacillus cycloheptanicus]
MAESFPEEAAVKNPLSKLVRVWKVAERISVSLSILLVLGTVGYLSVHALT